MIIRILQVARQFMPFVMSVVNAIACVIVLVLPALVAIVVDSEGSGSVGYIISKIIIKLRIKLQRLDKIKVKVDKPII